MTESEGNPRRATQPTKPWVLERIVHRAQPHLSENMELRIPPWVMLAAVIVVMLGAGFFLYVWAGQALNPSSPASRATPIKSLASPTVGALNPTGAPVLGTPAAQTPAIIIPGKTATPLPSATPAGSQTRKYRVQAGDTLTSIAIKFGVSIQSLVTANGLKSDVIRIGDDLVIPSP